MSCPSIWATLSALLINILLGSFQLFLHSDQPLSEGEIIPGQRCLPVGGRLHVSRRRRGGFTRLTGCFDVQPTTLWQRHRRASFSALASTNSFVYLHRAQQHALTHLRSVIAAFASFSSALLFVALGFVGNGVITVMINSP